MLTERQQQILQLIVQLYGQVEEPIGSKTLLAQSFLDVSPATIRNDMLSLERLGYLKKAHTSSGRIPSFAGYRYYVNALINHDSSFKYEDEFNDQDDIWAFNQLIRTKQMDINQKAKIAADVLVSLTGYTAIVLGPALDQHLITEFKLLYLSEYETIAIVVTDQGLVESQIFNLKYSINKDTLNKASELINEELKGLDLTSAYQRMKLTLPLLIQRIIAYQLDFSSLIEKALNQLKADRYYVSGKNNLFDFIDSRTDLSHYKTIFNLIEGSSEFFNLLEHRPKGIDVLFGNEIVAIGLTHMSMMTHVHLVDDQKLLIGLIGPETMPYHRIIQVMQLITEELSS